MWNYLRQSSAFWFGICFIFGAALALPFAAIEKRTHSRLIAEGEMTIAAVVNRGQRNDNEGYTHWLQLTYYDLKLNEHNRQYSVPKDLWDQHPVGSMIRVRYLRDDPQKVTPEAMIHLPEWKSLLAMGITFSAIGVPIVTLAFIKAKRVRESAETKDAS